MRPGSRWQRLWRRLWRRSVFEQQLDDELRFHLERRTQDLVEAGYSPTQAARQARIEFGGLDGYKERCRQSAGLHLIDDLRNDVLYAVRSLRKHALLSITVVATLTVGIGISSGVFNMIDGAFFSARDVTDPSSFAAIYSTYIEDTKQPGQWPGASTLQDYTAFRDGTHSLSSLAGYAVVRSALELDNPARVDVLTVSCNFFQVYQLEHAKLGRLLQTDDCSTSRPVIVLSESLWRQHFAADAKIIGKAVVFSGQQVTVVGVAPAPFNGPWGGSIAWLPYTIAPSQNSLFLVGRLNSGFSRADAAAEFNILAAQQDRLRRGVTNSVSVTDGSLYQNPANRTVMPWIFAFNMGLLGLVTLLACANVTALLLSRAHARQQEIAIRLALGAGRARLMRMLLTETLLLAFVAGAASLYCASRVPTLFFHLVSLPMPFSTHMDWRVFLYLGFLTLLAGIVSGLAPASEAMSGNLSDSLKGFRHLFGGTGKAGKFRNILVGTQVTFSFVLLVGAGLSLRSYQKAFTIDPGFETGQVIVAEVGVSESSGSHSWAGFHDNVTQELSALPGVQSVAFGRTPPFVEQGQMVDVQLPGGPLHSVTITAVSPDFFRTLRIPILAGRPLQRTDSRQQDVMAAVVSQALTRKFFNGQNPLGKRLLFSQGGQLEIVGVARDLSYLQMGQTDGPMLYVPWQPESHAYTAFVSFRGNDASLSKAVTAAIRKASPALYIATGTIRRRLEQGAATIVMAQKVFGVLAGVALLLAVIGIYGVVSFAVKRRMKEMGIRIAFGARKKDIYRAVLGSSLRPVIAGLLAGLVLSSAGAWILARISQDEPLPIDLRDPVAYVAVAIFLAFSAFTAMLGPAHRAGASDPVNVLRQE